jgi:hypothetical protein
MATTSPTNIPEAPYTDAPYLINDEWCIGDSIDVVNANTEYFENNKVAKSGDIMTGPLTVLDDVEIGSGGRLTLNCGELTDFSVNVKTVEISTTTPDQKYVLSHEDCGKVVVVKAFAHGFVSVPNNLPLGFNAMLVSDTTYNLAVIEDDPALGTRVVNMRNYRSFVDRYGICNLLVIQTNPVVALISGDLD